MPIPPPQHELPHEVQRTLRSVRRHIRGYVWLEGLAKLAILLSIAFWIGMLFDWWLEPGPRVRAVVLIGMAMVALVVLYRTLLRRMLVRISDSSLSLLLERRFSHLNDHLQTTVHLASSKGKLQNEHPEFIRRTQEEAEAALKKVRLGSLFDRRSLVRVVVIAFGLAGSIGLFAILANESFGFWLERVRLSPEPWPRRVHLLVVGFPEDDQGERHQKIAREDDLELLVRADVTGEFVVPNEVEIRFRLKDGRRGRDTMIRVGNAVPGRDKFQLFRYPWKRVTDDMVFDVVGGDDRVRNLHLRVVDRPELLAMELACDYPAYLQRPSRRLPITGGMQIPEGTRLTLFATSTKPLVEFSARRAQEQQDEKIVFAEGPSQSLLFPYGTLVADEVLLVDATDVDGIGCRQPYRVSLSVVPDELPQVAIRLSGIGAAITPDAVIPLAGVITDDYGLERIWFEYQVGESPTEEQSFAEQPAGRSMVRPLERFDTRAQDGDAETSRDRLALEPGQTLFLTVMASDQYDLSDMPRVGRSQRFALQVVTPSQLLAEIERREMVLRQRFQATHEKLTDTRNLLARIKFEDPPGEAASAAGPPARRRLRIAGSLQNITQSTHEILGIAEGFDDIVAQLENNRIQNTDLKIRLKNDIGLPLHRIGETGMPRLEKQLQLVQKHLETEPAGPNALKQALLQADKLLVEMQQVLDRMLELETYNEVVTLLRGILADQEKVNRETKTRRKQQLESLLED